MRRRLETMNELKNFFENQEVSRRDFLKSLLKISAGATILSAIPSIVSATTLSEWKEGKRFKFDDTKIKVSEEITLNDEAEIGAAVVGAEGLLIRETDLQFTRSLERRIRTDGVVIHHVGNTDKNINAAAIHRWHINNGWKGIGYHFIIRKDGSIERGRPLESVGAHCYNQNEHTVGICVVGNFELARPTQAQFRSAEKLIGAICGIYEIIPNDQTIVGHKYYNRTACPGTYLQKWVPDIIRNANKFC